MGLCPPVDEHLDGSPEDQATVATPGQAVGGNQAEETVDNPLPPNIVVTAPSPPKRHQDGPSGGGSRRAAPRVSEAGRRMLATALSRQGIQPVRKTQAREESRVRTQQQPTK